MVRTGTLVIAPVMYLLAMIVAAFAPQGGSFAHIASMVGLFAGLVCWVLSIYMWSQRTGNPAARIVILALLVLFGFLWSWAYIWANARRTV